MTIPLELEEPTLSNVRREAERLGVEMQEVVRKIVEQSFPQQPNLTPEEQLKAWREYTSRNTTTVVLSDYAMSRESMYENERADR